MAMVRKVIAVLLTALIPALLVLTYFSMPVLAIAGSGTVGDPWIITDATELQSMNTGLADYWELGNDIDASATSGWNAGAGFVPIGALATPFTGHLDGKGFNITDLYIDRPATDYVGFIGYGSNCDITDVHLISPDITGQHNVGTFAGLILLTTGGGVSKNSVREGEVHGKDDTGGFVGEAGGTTTYKFHQCFATGVDVYGLAALSPNYHSVGGFVGNIIKKIENCYTRNTLHQASRVRASGFHGDMSATGEVYYSYSASTKGTGNCNYGFGIGEFEPVEHCFWDGTLWGDEYAWGAYDAGGTELTTAEAKTEAIYTDEGWDFTTIWSIGEVWENAGYPYLQGISGLSLIIWYQSDAIVVSTNYDGTADAGSTDVKIIDAELTQVDDYWNLALLTITDTTDDLAPEGETAVITDFLAATDELQFAALTANVDVNDTYTVDFGTIVDRALSNDGVITWGVNPSDISYTVGALVSTDVTIPATTEGTEDVMPTGFAADLWGMSAPTNAFSDIVNSMAIAADVPAVVMWVSIAMFFVILTMGLLYWKFENITIAGLVGAFLIIVFAVMGILPKWAILLGVIIIALPVLTRREA